MIVDETIKKGKEEKYSWSDEERDQLLKEYKENGRDGNVSVQRYKGLGEMNAEQLWDTTMDPEERLMYQIRIDEAEEADRTFETLMGSEVAPRKKFIQSHAKKVKNLDI